jgi:hypothetical protein
MKLNNESVTIELKNGMSLFPRGEGFSDILGDFLSSHPL